MTVKAAKRNGVSRNHRKNGRRLRDRVDHANRRVKEVRSADKLSAALVHRSETIGTTLRHMADEVALIIDNSGCLCGLVTDGDIRRAFLHGGRPDMPVSEIMTRAPLTIRVGIKPAEIRSIMLRNQVRHLPVVDVVGRPIGLELLKEHYDELQRPDAVIMAGGQGIRLRPLTLKTPKPLLPLGDRTILDNIIDCLGKAEISDVIISANYLCEQIKEHIGDGPAGLNVSYVEEKKRLGTAGSLALISPPPSSSIVVMNGDLVTELDFKALVSFHRRQGNDMTVCVRRHDFTVPYGVVNLNPDSKRIDSIVEKPKLDMLINAGVYILEPHIIRLIPYGQEADMVWLIRQALKEGNRVGAFPVLEYWRDIGRFEEIDQARREWSERESAADETITGMHSVPAHCHSMCH